MKRPAIALTAADIEKCKKEGKVAIIPGSQDGSIIEANVDNVDYLFRLGYRVIQLTYNRRNLIGDGCSERTDAGLSKLGIAVIERMNELGMLIDLSHVGPETTREATEFSNAPVCFTHANANALCEHFRNKSDEALKAVAEKGGVIGINVISSYTRTRPDVEPDIEDYYNMMDYVVNLVGPDHVGIGTDISPDWSPEEIAKTFEIYPELLGTEAHLPGLDSVIYFRALARGTPRPGVFGRECAEDPGGQLDAALQSDLGWMMRSIGAKPHDVEILYPGTASPVDTPGAYRHRFQLHDHAHRPWRPRHVPHGVPGGNRPGIPGLAAGEVRA